MPLKQSYPEVYHHLLQNQSTLRVYPTMSAAREHYFRDLQDQPPYKKLPVEQLPNRLSMVLADSNPRNPVTAIYISCSSDPYTYRGYKAIILFPVGIDQASSMEFYAWKEAELIHERYKIKT